MSEYWTEEQEQAYKKAWISAPDISSEDVLPGRILGRHLWQASRAHFAKTLRERIWGKTGPHPHFQVDIVAYSAIEEILNEEEAND